MYSEGVYTLKEVLLSSLGDTYYRSIVVPLDHLRHNNQIGSGNLSVVKVKSENRRMNERMDDGMSGVWRSYSKTKKRKEAGKMDLSDLFTDYTTERLTGSLTD